MRILLLDQFSDPGGAQFCLRDLMPELVGRGWRPVVMAPGNGALLKWSSGFGIPTYPLPLGQYSNGRKKSADFPRYALDLARAARAVRSVIRREGTDVIYANGPRVLPALLGAGCPVVFHAHSTVHALYQRKLIQWILRSTKASVIAASAFVGTAFESANVIYSGVGDLWSGPRTFARRTARIGIIGRIAPEKGHLDFVRAAIDVARRGGDAEFFIYGERMFADVSYENRVRAMAQGSAVTFCGWADNVSRALSDLEILAVPSGPGEAAARVIMEAFSAGTPVVAYRAGGIPELVKDGRTGLLTQTPDAESLAGSIGILLRDRALMERLSSEGRREWERRFTVERFRSTVCDLVERCAQNAPMRGARNSRETRRAALAPERAHDETHASQ